jgi:hypothetical protein
MDRFPDATAQDLARCDGICIICREEMSQAGLNKKLHCGHVFHLHCLRCVGVFGEKGGGVAGRGGGGMGAQDAFRRFPEPERARALEAGGGGGRV